MKAILLVGVAAAGGVIATETLRSSSFNPVTKLGIPVRYQPAVHTGIQVATTALLFGVLRSAV